MSLRYCLIFQVVTAPYVPGSAASSLAQVTLLCDAWWQHAVVASGRLGVLSSLIYNIFGTGIPRTGTCS